MAADLKSRWIMVGCCWMAVFILTLWNLNKIDSSAKAMEKKEIYRMDEQFWNYNAANISDILKKSASLIQEVESPKISLFEFESNLRNLALTSGLDKIKLTTQSQVERDGIIPVIISFKSSVRHAANWFDRLGIELPHAQVRDVKIESDESTKENKFAVSLYYRYRQSAMEGSI
jgi:hypothetical protein